MQPKLKPVSSPIDALPPALLQSIAEYLLDRVPGKIVISFQDGEILSFREERHYQIADRNGR